MKTIFLSITVIGFATGCSTRQSLPDGLRTEAQSGGNVKLLPVEVTRDGSGLLVHGTVERTFGYFDNPSRHLDLEVRSATGELIEHRAVKFFPNPIPHNRFGVGRAVYSERLAEVPPTGSSIRLTVDANNFADCKIVKFQH